MQYICLSEIGMEPIELEPRDIARTVFDRVMHYCATERGYTLECAKDHSPDQLSIFIDGYLTKEEAEELDKAIESSETFWDEVKKEYEELWKSWWSEKLAYSLGHLILKEIAERIAKDDRLDNASKVERLKAYAEVLHEFADAIQQALQNREPLSSAYLYKWFKRLAEFAPSHRSEYIKDVEYYLNFYEMSDVDDQLQTLSILPSYIDMALTRIEYYYLPELEALTNES